MSLNIQRDARLFATLDGTLLMQKQFHLAMGLSFLIQLASTAAYGFQPTEGGPIAHWPLAKEASDAAGGEFHGKPRGVQFATADGHSFAQFDGHESVIEVPHSPKWQLGKGDFSVALWLHTDEKLADDLGELISQYDAKHRRGFSLSLRNNCVTSSQANYRQLQFGIDNGTQPKWTDLGRPGNSLYGMSMCVHDGRLYCGTCEPAADQAGHVYRYEGGTSWVDLGSPDKSNAVVCMAVHRGKLHIGTGKYRLGGSALAESENANLGGRIFRLDDGDRWTLVGHLPGVEATAALVVFRDTLYASSLYRPAGFYRYEGEQNWTALETPGGKRPESLGVYNGYLWATGYDEGHIYRFDGQNWKDMGALGENTQTYSFAVERGRLYVGTWPSGKVYRLSPQDEWQDTGRLGEELEVMGMLLHNGKLYAGTLPLAEMFRYDGDQQWNSVGRLDLTPDVKYRRIWSCAQYQGRLVATTLPSGHVHALEAGKCVTHDYPLPPGWRHVTAVRGGERLRLYVDGKQVAVSTPLRPADFDLSTEQPLLIGGGPGDYFSGRLRDVRLYRRALDSKEIHKLATE